MNDHQDHIDDDQQEVRAPTLSGDPERELELKLKKDPGNKSAQIDVGSDQSDV